MLSEKRINEAKTNIKSYLEDGLLKKKNFEKIVYDIFLKNSRESLEVAQNLIKESLSDLWVIVTSYYSMYYIANAVIYKLGYKIGDKISHKVTSDALIYFVRDKLNESLISDYEELMDEALANTKTDKIIGSFDHERKKRGFIQYATQSVEIKAKAKTSFERAKAFIDEMEKLLDII